MDLFSLLGEFGTTAIVLAALAFLQRDVRSILSRLDAHATRLDGHGERIAFLEGRAGHVREPELDLR